MKIPAYAKSFLATETFGGTEIEFSPFSVEDHDSNLGFRPIELFDQAIAVRDVLQQIREKESKMSDKPPLTYKPSPVTPIIPSQTKQERYKSSDGRDLIDETYDDMPFSEFAAAIFWTMRKYMKRFGQKDDIELEARKIKDYANRFYEKVLLEKEKAQ